MDKTEEEIRQEIVSELEELYQSLEARQLHFDGRIMKWNATIDIMRQILVQTGDNLALSAPLIPGMVDKQYPIHPKDEDLPHFVDLAYGYMKMGRDFALIMQEINSNELLKAQWDKLLMSMKLVEEK